MSAQKDTPRLGQSTSISVPIQPVGKQPSTSRNGQKKQTHTSPKATGTTPKGGTDTKLKTTIDVMTGGPSLDEQTHSSKMPAPSPSGSGSQSKKQKQQSSSPIPPVSDAGSTRATKELSGFSQTMGPLQQSKGDYQKILQEKEKLLDDRKKELDEKDKEIHKLMDDAKAEREENKARHAGLEKQLAEHKNIVQDLENAMEINQKEKLKLRSDLDSKEFYIQHLKEALNTETDKLRNAEEKAKLVAHNNKERIEDLTKERNELRSRLSKAASDMLTAGGNPDIADLSDPNRALKLSERFSSLYDDPWTDAFEILTQQHNQDPKAVIEQLLSILKTCFEFCKQTEQSQMDSLRNLFMHPCQSASQDVKASKDKPVTMGTGEDKALKDLRRRIATNSLHEVNAQCMSLLRKQLSAKDDVTMGAARAYSERCIDLCWLMVLHDPPLHLALDVKPGTKMGTHYSNYGGSGDTIDYVVWPPLYNGLGGGLLTKGTAAPLISKKKAPNK